MIILMRKLSYKIAFTEKNTTFFHFFVAKTLSYYKVYSAREFFFLRLIFCVISCYFFYLVIFISWFIQQISYPICSIGDTDNHPIGNKEKK